MCRESHWKRNPSNHELTKILLTWRSNVSFYVPFVSEPKYLILCHSSQGAVYTMDELTGGLALIHRLVLRTRDFPGCPGEVTCMRWTSDGTALAMTWGLGGFSIWSTFGAMIMCSLCWDYGSAVSDPVTQNPLCLRSIVSIQDLLFAEIA